jgi:hypothetical protein
MRLLPKVAAPVAAFAPLSFAPGGAYRFDWGHEVVLIGGTTVTVKVAHGARHQPRVATPVQLGGPQPLDGLVPR